MPEEKETNASPWLQLKEGKQWSRLLYTNPVCFLCTTPKNVMVVSWLTATNNGGQFVLSLHRRRHTASAFQCPASLFTLSVPVQGMEDLVRSVGRVSGAQVNKLESVPGLMAIAPRCANDAAAAALFCIDGTVAHMICRVEQVLDVEPNHWLIVAQIQAASVCSVYWNGAKNLFRPSSGVPPYLTFFGSQTFGYVMTADDAIEPCSQPTGST